MPRAVLGALVAASVAGCQGAPKSSLPSPFLTLEGRIGETLQVEGFHHHRFENHNLFPTAREALKPDLRHRCIPVRGVRALSGTLKALHGKYVVIEGTVERFYDSAAGELSFLYCKEIGLTVKSIRRR